MVDISKLTPEQVKLFNEMKVGGLNQEELDKLAKAGVAKELLEAMKTEFPATGEIPSSEPKFPEEKGPKFWENLVGYFKRDDVSIFEKGAIAVAGTAVAALGGWGAVAALGAKGAITAVAALGVGGLLSSCTVSADARAEASIIIPKDATNEEIIKLLKEGNYTTEQILAELQRIGKAVDVIVEILYELGTSIDKIVLALGTLNQTADQIVNILLEQNKANEAAAENLGDSLKTIIELLKQGNALSEENNALLKQILAKMETTTDDAGIALLKEILAKLTESIKQNQAMGEKTHSYLNDILAKLGEMDATQKAGFAAVLNALEGLGDNADAILEAIFNGYKLTQEQLDAIIKNQNIQNANFESLKELIMKNNEIAQGTQDAVKALGEDVKKSHAKILDKLAAGNATLGEILTLLKALKADTSQIGDIKQFVNIIGSAIEKLLEEVKGLRAETQSGLLAILAKIPDGCKCQPADLSDLLAKLEIIIQELQKNPGDDVDNPKHEGVLDDLGDYFG